MEQELLPACDQEVFQRVWKRVMPHQRPDCPLELKPRQEETALPAVVVSVEPPVEEGTACVCLGPASSGYGAQLRDFVDQELAGYRCCQLLARRVPGNGGRMLAAMAADRRRRAKRLSTAYFLISGVRYWPADRMGEGEYPPVLAGLRELFQSCQQAAALYRTTAAESTDPCLAELFRECGEEAESHAWTIRSVLEQL